MKAFWPTSSTGFGGQRAPCTRWCSWCKFYATMNGRRPMRSEMTKLTLALLASVAITAEARAQASYPCVNDAPNPYHMVNAWAQTPRPWGPVNAVVADSHDNIWAFDRCGADGCSASNNAPIFEI